MTASSSIVDPRADHDMRLDQDVAADPGVAREKHGFGRDQRRASEHGAFARRRCIAASAARELDAVVDAHHLLFRRPRATRAASPLRCGDRDEVGQIKFARGVVGADRLQHLERARARKRHRAGVAAADRALRRARVLVFADGDEHAVALDQPSVACRVGGLEAERGQPGALRRARRAARAASARRISGVSA